MHSEEAVKEVREAVVHATAKREQLSPGLGRLLRRHIEDAKKHLFELSQKLAHGLDRRGLKLFKRRGGKMFVSRVKPRPIDPGVVLSPRIASIVERIKAEAGIATSKLVAELAPAPAVEAGAEDQPKQLTEEQKGLAVDLHWLVNEGYVISYSDGVLFLGVQGDPPQHAPGAKAEANETADEGAAEASPEGVAADEGEVTQESDAAPTPSAQEHPLPTEDEEAAAAEAAEAAGADANPSGAD
jgi:hypothetical protein